MALPKAYGKQLNAPPLLGEPANIEIGTFTPIIVDGSLNADEGQTYNIQIGRYTRIGDLIVFDVHLDMLTMGGLQGNGPINVGGFPYRLKAGIIGVSMVGWIAGMGGLPVVGQPLGMRHDPGTNTMRLMVFGVTAGHNSVTVIQHQNGAMKFSGTYVTDEPLPIAPPLLNSI